jgi:D-hexose-6-phosphate mutarotase
MAQVPPNAEDDQVILEVASPEQSGSGPLHRVHVIKSTAPRFAKIRIVVEKSGSDSTVVWNRWIEKGMPDMAPGDSKQVICVEPFNVGDNVVHLLPGGSHKLMTLIRAE